MQDKSRDEDQAGAAAVTPSAHKDDRLDGALALLLAFVVLGGLVLYATKPWQGGVGGLMSSLGARPAEVTASAPVLAASEPAASAAALQAAVVEPETPASVPMVALAVPAVAAAVPVVVASAPAPVVPVVVAPSAPAVVASAAPEPVVVAPPAPAPEPVKPAEPAVVIRENIQFDVNQATVPASAKERLNEIAKILADDPRSLKISGHTDSQGKHGANTVLSLRRAEAVRHYLIAQGASAERLKAVGFGPDRPIADNKTPEGRAKNRRIDITE